MAKIKAMVKALEQEGGRPSLVRKRTRTPSKKSPGKKSPAASSKKAKLMTLDSADHSYLADLLLISLLFIRVFLCNGVSHESPLVLIYTLKWCNFGQFGGAQL